MNEFENSIFSKRSTTFFPSSRLFPKAVMDDVSKLYSFVRVADDYVDCIPQQADKFFQLKALWQSLAKDPDLQLQSTKHQEIDTQVVENIVNLTRKYQFDQDWIDAFFKSMSMDIPVKGQSFHKVCRYETLADTLRYVYGSAEVVGLMMAKIMGLPENSFNAARMQGRSFQWLNFIRDIPEDTMLGRQYFPLEDLQQFGFSDLQLKTVKVHPVAFKKFIQFELDRYKQWQFEAQKGYTSIPAKLLKPLKAAVKRYDRTAKQIAQEPFIVFGERVSLAASKKANQSIVLAQ